MYRPDILQGRITKFNKDGGTDDDYFYPSKDVKLCSGGKVGKELEYCGFGLLKLEAGEIYESKTCDEEAVLAIMSGKCNVSVSGEDFIDLGGRKDVFSGNPTSVYIPLKVHIKSRRLKTPT